MEVHFIDILFKIALIYNVLFVQILCSLVLPGCNPILTKFSPIFALFEAIRISHPPIATQKPVNLI